MKLSVLIPCYNEIATIQTVVDRVKQSQIDIEKEIIIIDDHSTDGTRELLKQTLETQVRKVIYHDRNRGKGAALNSGLKAATGDLLIIQDADMEYDPSEFPKLIKPILDGEADVVYGSRFLTTEARRVLYFGHYMGNRVLTFLSNLLTNMNLTDMETCYKVFKKDVYQNLDIQENRFGIEPEVTAKVAKMKKRVYEIGISYHGRTFEEGKKITWKDGVSALRCILKYNLFA